MKDTTLISVVTPVCNGASFLESAYKSLCRQSYPHWEWVVVNDGSTDETEVMMRRLAEADRRVRYTRQWNSGTAKQPRDRAVLQAKGELILPLDADDTIEDNYLQKMFDRMQETEADIVYPQMHFIDMSTGVTTQILPVADFDTTRVYEGRSLVRETLPEWRIGCNGGLYRRANWINMSWPEKREPVWMNSDEIDERLYQLQARRVAFAAARYDYRNHPASTTIRISPKRFHVLKTCLQLLDLTAEEFGPESEEHRRAGRKAFFTWRSMMALYMEHHEQLTDAEGLILQRLRQVFGRIDTHVLTIGERLQFLNLCSYPLLFALFCLKYSPHLLIDKLMQHFRPDDYRWKVVRRRTELQMRTQIEKSYTEARPLPSFEPYAISMFCGNVSGGGLVDRLRGAVSVFMECKRQERLFRLYFTHPFQLTDYLVPNTYDWRIGPNEVTFAPNQTHVVIADTQTDTERERQYQRNLFSKELTQHAERQQHFYTNAAFCYDEDFYAAFHELFKPSERLAKHIERQRTAIGGAYITVSARFCNLLDDFNEETYNEPLSYDEREALVRRCTAQIALLHAKHPDRRIVVCADSETFLDRVRSTDYITVIPGKVSHIGNDRPHTYDYYEKTFLDFFIISGAERVYLLRAEGMHNSGFPRAAALTGRKPYEVIAF